MIISRKEEVCKYQLTRKGCTKEECNYYHLTSEEKQQRTKERRDEEKKQNPANSKPSKHANDIIKKDSEDGAKNGMMLGADLEQLIQNQLVKILSKNGFKMMEATQEETGEVGGTEQHSEDSK